MPAAPDPGTWAVRKEWEGLGASDPRPQDQDSLHPVGTQRPAALSAFASPASHRAPSPPSVLHSLVRLLGVPQQSRGLVPSPALSPMHPLSVPGSGASLTGTHTSSLHSVPGSHGRQAPSLLLGTRPERGQQANGQRMPPVQGHAGLAGGLSPRLSAPPGLPTMQGFSFPANPGLCSSEGKMLSPETPALHTGPQSLLLHGGSEMSQ